MGSILVGLACFGCVDPEGQYDEFQDRDKKTTLPQGTGCGVDPSAPCDPVTVGALDGQWLFALSATLAPTKPILFFADVTSADAGGQVEWQWTLTPLDAKTREPVPGTPIEIDPSQIPADGQWSVTLPPLDVPGAANPITGSDITAEAGLTGDVCGGRDFLCGDVSGNVSKPIVLDLAGSTWTLQRLTAPDTLPDTIYINCSCVEAEPPAP